MNEDTTTRERMLLQALQDIVLETMDFAPMPRYSIDSYLPADYIEFAQQALAQYNRRIEPLPPALLVGYRKPSEQLQPRAVRGPVGERVGGDTAVAVQVYALGRGIATAGEGAHLGVGEGAFEIESHGVRVIVDPAGAVESHRLVTPIERHVLAIWQTVEAVDQEQLAKFGFGVGHEPLQAKTAILSLPQGSGKTLLARNMAARLGCRWVLDAWCEDLPLLQGALHLTHLPVDDLMEVAA